MTFSQLKNDILARAEANRRFTSGVDTEGFLYLSQLEEICREVLLPHPATEAEPAIIERILTEAREGRYFESGVDRVGFVYINQLREILDEVIGVS